MEQHRKPLSAMTTGPNDVGADEDHRTRRLRLNQAANRTALAVSD